MYKQTIEFTSTPINITSADLIPHEIMMTIFDFIQFVKYDFNQDIHNSSAYLFNASPLNTATILTSEFVQYLNRNLRCFVTSNNEFNPFFTNQFLKQNIDPSNVIKITGNMIRKKQNIMFDTKSLMEAFVVDAIYDILKNSPINNFLISSKHFFRADSRLTFPIEYKIEIDKIYKSKISSGTTYFHYPRKRKLFPKGYNIDISNFLIARLIVFETFTAIDSRVIASMTKDLHTKKQFEDFSFRKRQRLVVYDEDLTSHVFNYR